MNSTLLAVFIPTFIAVSITPGMCMTLAMSLGMSVGFRKTLWMIVGELVGVGLVALSSVAGVAIIMFRFPQIFIVLKIVGGIYLLYLGLQLWRSRGKMAVCSNSTKVVSSKSLIAQGFITAVANPKGWAFFVALLPPFIDSALPILPQLIFLVAIILSIEFISLLLYALGGSTLRGLLQKEHHVKLLNRIAGVLMAGVGLWLILE